jgi:hypothetical protein
MEYVVGLKLNANSLCVCACVFSRSMWRGPFSSSGRDSEGKGKQEFWEEKSGVVGDERTRVNGKSIVMM